MQQQHNPKYSLQILLEDRSWVTKSCISSEVFNQNLQAVKLMKFKDDFRSEKEMQPNQNIQKLDRLYEKWEDIYRQSLENGQIQPFKSSVLNLFKIQTWAGLFVLCIGIICHNLTPYVLYLIYQNIAAKTFESDKNKSLVFIIVFFRLLRVFCCYYSEMKLNQIGLKMYHLVSLAITKKTLKCSPLSNKNILASQLIKMMHNDCYNIISYPVKIGVMLQMTITHICLPIIAISVAGMSGAIGIGLLFTMLILRFMFKKQLAKGQKLINLLSSQRIKATIEVFNIIKLIKVNSLQSCYFNKLRQLRKSEVIQLKYKVLLEMIQNTTITITKPLIMILVSKLLVAQKGYLHPQVLFTFNLCLSFINLQAIVNSFNYLDLIANSFENIEKAMGQRQLKLNHLSYIHDPASPFSVQIANGTFKWDVQPRLSQRSQFQIGLSRDRQSAQLKNVNLKIKRGEFVAIIGGYGAGKTSLVESLLGEMDKVGNPKVTINGIIAYASQVPWIINDTIKNNILFGKPYDEKRYKQAIKYSSLESDLKLFKNGDLSMIGKRGSTLSGGQKARVSFARALYSNADIYILDDILSAVDAHVGSFLFFMGIKEYLKGKTVLLITHSVYFAPHTDRILILEDGQIKKDGTYVELSFEPIFNNVQAAKIKNVFQYRQVLSRKVSIKAERDVSVAAELFEQQISVFESFKFYIKRNSGTIFVVVISLFVLIIGSLSTYSQVNLNNWSYSSSSNEDIYLYISLALNTVKICLTLLLARVLYFSKLFQSIHDDMIKNLLFSPYSYFESVPSAKIINRLSNDLATNDKIITCEFGYLLINLQLLLSFVFGIFYVYSLNNYYFLILFFFVYAIVTFHYFQTYFRLSIQVNKIQQEFLIPINSKYNETIDGLTSIRAYKKMQFILSDLKEKLQTFAIVNTLKTLIDSRIKFILLSSSNLLAILKVVILIFYHEGFRSNSIFLLFNFFSMEDGIFRFYNSLAAFAPRLQSLGKCQQLTSLEAEAGYKDYLQANWIEDSDFKSIFYDKNLFPNGQITFQNYQFRYKPESQDVLKDISFVVRPGEKIGIVGRTGSGKSTMLLGLLRIVEAFSGRILIDGIDISRLSLEQLRSNINIILQDHYLFTGTIKENIDPTNTHTDSQIVEVLKLCGIWQKFEGYQGLRSPVAEGGDNLSSGQKQLINIARSLLNPKKIVLIDQATASIDLQADILIQKVMRKQFADMTVLTIAHRINTVLDSDRILVLQKGKISQFDSPSNLLKNQTSLFAGLFHQSGKKTLD